MNTQAHHNKLHFIQQKYLSALLAKDRHVAERIINACLDEDISIKDIYLSVFQPTQMEIGTLWQHNKISVAMEHYCTAATQFIMTRLYDHIFSTEKNGCSLVATSVSGELHELGIRMVSDFFEMEGWHTYYLGANTPKQGVVDMINESDTDVLAISTTIYFHIPKVAELIEFVRTNVSSNKLKIMVGGNAFNMNPLLWQQVKADAYAANAQDAINQSKKLINPAKPC